MAACPWCDRVVLALHTHLLPPGMRHHWPRWHLPSLAAFLANEDWTGGPRSQTLTGEGLLGTQLPTYEMTMGTEPFLPDTVLSPLRQLTACVTPQVVDTMHPFCT